jgi:hypothetical protein
LGLRPNDNAYFHSLGSHRPPEPLPRILRLPAAFEPLEALVYALRPNIILIDSMRQSNTADESDSQEMAEVMGNLRQLAEHGAAVVVIHHTRKNDDQLRGSTEIEAGTDAIINVSDGIANWAKTRGWEMADPNLAFPLDDDGDATYLRGGMSLTQLLSKEGPLSVGAIAEKMGVSPNLVKLLLKRAKDRDMVQLERNVRGDNVVALK